MFLANESYPRLTTIKKQIVQYEQKTNKDQRGF
jgi:hypothetical protein